MNASSYYLFCGPSFLVWLICVEVLVSSWAPTERAVLFPFSLYSLLSAPDLRLSPSGQMEPLTCSPSLPCRWLPSHQSYPMPRNWSCINSLVFSLPELLLLPMSGIPRSGQELVYVRLLVQAPFYVAGWLFPSVTIEVWVFIISGSGNPHHL